MSSIGFYFSKVVFKIHAHILSATMYLQNGHLTLKLQNVVGLFKLKSENEMKIYSKLKISN